MDAFLEVMNHYVNYVADEYSTGFFFLGGSFFLLFHFRVAQSHNQSGALLALMSLAVITIIAIALTRQQMSIWRVLSLCYIFGVVAFAALSQILRDGLAARLTKRRGEKWLKELDYAYILLGAIGVLATVNHLPFVTDKIDFADAIAPLILTSAVVLRLIKTRADIGGWARLVLSSKRKKRL